MSDTAQETLKTSLAETLPAFQSAWEALSADFIASESEIMDIYGLSQDKMNYLTGDGGVFSKMNGALMGVSTALAADDVATLVEKGAGIKPNFVKFFTSMGDFIEPFKVEMVTMEQAYLPVLYCTNNPGDVDTLCQGVAGIETLIESLNGASTDFWNFYPSNLQMMLAWNERIESMNVALVSTSDIVAASATPDEIKVGGAHQEMESIRSTMFDLRVNYENYEFVMDSVTEYHDTFEVLVIAAMDKTVTPAVPKTSLTEEDKTILRDGMTKLGESFALMDTAVNEMDYALFGFSDLTEMNSLLDAQETNIGDLEAALATDSMKTDEEIANLAVDLKKKFVPFFKRFGAF